MQKHAVDLKSGVAIYKKSKSYVDGLKGQINGLATLNSEGKVPASQLPSFVDDVIEGYKTTAPSAPEFSQSSDYGVGVTVTHDSKIYRFKVAHEAGAWNADEVEEIQQFPTTGETGKIYVDITDGKTYRWSGTQYTQISGDEGWIKGIASGTTENHILVFGSDGYRVKDSGKTIADLESTAVISGSATGTSDASSETSDPYLNFVQGGSVKKSHKIKGGTNVSVKFLNGELVISSTDTDTHHQAKAVVCGSASGKVNAAVTGEGGVYLNIVENDTVRSSHKIVGDNGAVKVTSDSNGNILISGKIATADEMEAAIDAYENAGGGTAGDAAVDAYIASLDA